MGTVELLARAGRASYDGYEALEQVAVQLGEQVERPVRVAPALPDDVGLPAVAVAGTVIAGEFRCVECGYGAIIQRKLPRCPMCGGTIWESRGSVAARGAS
jgi:rubrerythrin